MADVLRLRDLDHDQLVVLVHEYLLAGHLIDRAGIPKVVERGGVEVMTDIAIEEWRGASPVYTARMQRLLGFAGGDDVASMFKGMQLDIGAPPQFMDFRYRVTDDGHGDFWLDHCGALMDVEPMGEEFVLAMCHTIEDPTFPATACASNPRARVEPVHRPPRSPSDRHPHCHWTVTVDPAAEPAPEPEMARRIAATLAAALPLAAGDDAVGAPGSRSYDGDLRAVAPVAEMSDGTLRALAEEVALQGQLLALGFQAASGDHYGSEIAAEMGRAQLAGVGGITSERIREAFDLSGDLEGLAAVLELHPALRPRGYVAATVELDRDRVLVAFETCPALDETGPRSWAQLMLAGAEKFGGAEVLDAVVWGANPAASSTPIEVSGAVAAWEIRLADTARPEPDAVLLTRFSTGADFRFDYAADDPPRSVPPVPARVASADGIGGGAGR